MFQSILGIAALLIVGYLFCNAKNQVNWRTVGGALIIQLVIAGFVLATSFGSIALLAVSNGVANVLGFAAKGISFVFGNLVTFQVENLGFIFAFQVLPAIIFTASLVSLLHYMGIMGLVVKVLGGGLQKLIGSSKAESMNAIANTVCGGTEAPLFVKPWHPHLTKSEIFAIMVGGLASIAGSVLAGLAGMGVEIKYLVMACFMSAPAGLLFAKLIIPETEQTVNEAPELPDNEKPSNFIDAIAKGAIAGMQIAAVVGALLIACIGLIAMLNSMIGWAGGLFGFENVTLELLMGYAFAPIAWLIGVPWVEAIVAGSFIAQKLVLNEFVAFAGFAPYISGETVVAATGEVMSPKSVAVITVALCGFANIGSVSMVVAAISTMIPNKSSYIASVGMKVLLAATLANLLSATVVGLFMSF
ncbi:NupC/NupG family nucleoside CNT transporter [Shewanella schlegeliana]|uniref:NupC/NupG family nucleoside CNT transporter n=1 Tax=Shewanella schlegeliana TaxID=190308 RepID=A0ABS1SW76_9GAMM|nr:nucleoside transporter C-terminal domain-containing protein [Shewanella schlegeliana]MBL4912639.1 NupC/NupG family nucleoside CNT transporter [Shewanella schlegeliana]MCL1109853.1 NupC/NupG family nucleoside CNT transporter [Shewanella schlegeliana]GIU32728.1 nucleoside transporter NupC [Shewanella schlegeliana]